MTTQGKRERRLVWVAIIASLLLHVVIAFSLAAFSSASTPLPPPDDEPVQMTMVNLPPNPVNTPKPNPAFIDNDEKKETAAPQEKTFESNANSQAASEKPASSDLPVPTQDGREQPFLDLNNQRASLAMSGSKPQPTPPPEPSVAPTPPQPRASEPPKPTPVATPSATAAPLATPEPEKFAMLTSTPPPALRDTEETTPTPTPQDLPPTPPPQIQRPKPESPPSAAYQREQQPTRITGRLTNRGPSSVNAVATPLGKYQKIVSDAVGSRWYYYVKQRLDLVSVGTAHLEAEVDPSGRIRNLRILSNSSNESFANICLQSFQEAQIPPIPPDLVATLPEGRLPVDFYFTTYPNR